MTTSEFIGYLKNPDTIVTGDNATLRDLVTRFPYCTSSQILLAYRLFRDNDLDYPAQLKRVAAYAASRRKLKQMFEAFRPLEFSPAEPEEPDPFLQATQGEGRTREEELLAIVRKRLAEIKLEREQEKFKPDETAIQEAPGSLILGMTKDEIVDKFIHDKPRISTPKATFYRSSEKAVKSNVDDGEIVSETLALLYYRQGNTAKAMKIYNKLMLLFPEKSSYFAAQIKKMASPGSGSHDEKAD